MSTCPSCRDELDHCHGTLLVGIEVEAGCTEPACTGLSRERHELVAHGAGVGDGGAAVEHRGGHEHGDGGGARDEP
jgi:hypothetical protein